MGPNEDIADSSQSDEDYHALVSRLSSQAAEELRAARNDREAQRLALCRFYKRGLAADLTIGELIDFLGVSSPSILDQAGYNDAEAEAVMAISDALTEDEVDGVEI